MEHCVSWPLKGCVSALNWMEENDGTLDRSKTLDVGMFVSMSNIEFKTVLIELEELEESRPTKKLHT